MLYCFFLREPSIFMYMYMYIIKFSLSHIICIQIDCGTPPYNTALYIYICISYVTAVRYVAAINHEARGRAAPEGE